MARSSKKSLLKRFLPYYKPYKKMFARDLGCATVVAAVELVFPLLVRMLMNTSVSSETHTNLRFIWLTGLAILLMRVLDVFANYYIESRGHIMGAYMETDMRMKLFDKLMSLSFSYYDKTEVGQIMSRITTDLFDITEFAHHCPEEFYLAGLKITGAFIILCTVSVPLTLIIFAILPFMFLFAFIYNKKMRKAAKLRREKIGNINANVEDCLSGVRVVKSFANENVERKKFDKTSDEFLSAKKLSYHYFGVFHSGIRFFDAFMYLSVVVFGATFIALGKIDPSDLVAFVLYISLLLTAISRIVQFTEQFQQGMTGFERYVEIMDTPVALKDAPDAVDIGKVKGDVTFEDVGFSYGKDLGKVLNHINLDVKAGTNVAVVGPSGGGKTTLCSLIPRFYDVTEGRVLVDGKDVRSVTQKSLRENIGIVQQDVYIFVGTVRDNIAYGKPGATDEEIINAAKLAGAHDFIMALENGYDTHVGQRGVRLSGGQKQRICIARVFLRDPSVLIFDEATSALDNESELVVQTSLEKLSKGRTTFIIAHRLSTIRNADVIMVLTENGIEETGTHQELMEKKGEYYKLYNLYADVFSDQ